jgi:predicted ATPase
LHRRIGESEERFYGNLAGEIAAELAVHFAQGQDPQRAIKYFQQAAENGLRRHAHREAIAYQEKALELLQTLPDTPERAPQELSLQVALGVSLTVTKGFAEPAVERAYDRARTLCRRIGNSSTLFPVLYGLWNFYMVRSEPQATQELADQMLTLAKSQEESELLVAAYNAQHHTLFQLGDLTSAYAHLEQCLSLYDPGKHHRLAGLYGEDPGVSCRSFGAWVVWHLGYPDQARRHIHTAQKLAEGLAHPFSLAQALSFGAAVYLLCREGKRVQEMAETLIDLCRKHDFALWLAGGKLLHGWALTEQGQGEAGVTEMRQGLTEWRNTGAAIWWPCFLGLLAEAYGKVGRPEEGLKVLGEEMSTVCRDGEVWYEAEICRLKGELTFQQFILKSNQKGKNQKQKTKVSRLQFPFSTSQTVAEVEAHFHKALGIARRQQAKSLELRAAVSLARLWRKQEKFEEARQLLAEIYGWFTEGFDTVDLQEARVLLEELEGHTVDELHANPRQSSIKPKIHRTR